MTDFIACVGTGGTISGTARYLKEQNPEIQVIGVDPIGSILFDAWQNCGQIPENAQAAPYKVEGFGEDLIPSTLDLSLIDDILKVNDKESFLWARRLVREEGIFAGGSSGSAVAAAVRYAQKLGGQGNGNGHAQPERLVVVILPDSGSRYLSKIYDDKWMKENGFLEPDWNETPIGEILAAKSSDRLIASRTSDRMTDVIASLKKNDVSQVPVLHPDGTLAGLVTEVELLQHMVNGGHQHSPEETIAEVMRPTEAVFSVSTPLENVLSAFTQDQAVLVTEADRPVGILTKIDILDFISGKI